MGQIRETELSPTMWEAESVSTHPEPASLAQENPDESAEQNLIATLEELEHGLRSQGFIPLEPKSLSAIAQGQETALNPSQEAVKAQEHAEEPQYQQPPTLSSALAELGGYVSPSEAVSSTPASTPAEPLLPHLSAASSDQSTVVPASEPNWAISHPAVPAPTQEPSRQIPVQADEVSPPAWSVSPVNPQTFPEPMPLPQARADMLLESELETTMKRPAVRLQPMAQRPAAQREAAVPAARARTSEQIPVKAAESELSYQDRLLKGYQHQLVGDYDEAMQEYRIIIRSAPELLSEVVSNVRALLKLAPKYSAGYRVLGDAYMRQGEYLQAMEAYNKALTMAKRAKS